MIGMYTEFHFNATLADPPPRVVEMLQYMLATEKGSRSDRPGHPLFKTTRWSWMLTSDSYYFSADTHSTLRWDDIGRDYRLCIRCNLKNYDGEIEQFIDWIMPYVAAEPGEFLGFYRHEEAEDPTLIRKAGQR